ncbi:MAG: hypothetical protein AAFZ91_10040 [Pseudomonadota bacterium]
MPTLTQEFETHRAFRTPMPIFTKARIKRGLEIGLPFLGGAVGLLAALIAEGSFNLFS